MCQPHQRHYIGVAADSSEQYQGASFRGLAEPLRSPPPPRLPDLIVLEKSMINHTTAEASTFPSSMVSGSLHLIMWVTLSIFLSVSVACSKYLLKLYE